MIVYSATNRGDILRMTKPAPDPRGGFAQGDLVRVKERTREGVLVESKTGRDYGFVFNCGAKYLEPTEWKNDFPDQQSAPSTGGTVSGATVP
jgi:hypothetical protein